MGLKIFHFKLALSCVVEIFCINFTWCIRHFSQKLHGWIRRPPPAANSIVKLDIEWRQSGDRDGQGFRSKMKRVIAGLKTRQNGFQEPIKLARTRKLFRNPSSILSASIPRHYRNSLMEQQEIPIYFAFILEILLKRALPRIIFFTMHAIAFFFFH